MSKFEDPILLNNLGTIGTVANPDLMEVSDTGIDVDGNLTVNGALTITGAQYDTDWHYVGGSGEPAFQNGWVNYNTGTYPSARFRKLSNGCIIMEGLVKNGTVASTIFTLPVGYRPAGGILHLPLASPNSMDVAAFINVFPSGNVATGASSSNAWVSLNSAPFYESGGYPVQGPKGDKPDHEWNGTNVRFENPNGTWGDYTDLSAPTIIRAKYTQIVAGNASMSSSATVLYDTNSVSFNGSNQWVVPMTGFYIGTLQATPTGAWPGYAYITKNGSELATGYAVANSSTGVASFHDYLYAGDLIKFTQGTGAGGATLVAQIARLGS